MTTNKWYILFCIGCLSCQQMETPPMKIIPDPPTAKLKYYLPFDNETPEDSSIYRFPTLADAITYTDGISGKAMQGGNGRYLLIDTLQHYHGLNLKDSLTHLSGFTLSSWIYLTTDQAQRGGVAFFSIPDTKGTDWVGNLEIFFDGLTNNRVPVVMHLRNHRGGTQKDFWIAKDNTPGVYLDKLLDKWTHLTFRYSGKSSTVTYFRDGEKVLTVKHSDDFGDLVFRNYEKTVLGAFQNLTDPKIAPNAEVQGWETTFPGKIDQFRFYDSFLTDKEIKDIYNSKR